MKNMRNKKTLLPTGDHTPIDFSIEKENNKEKLKKVVREYLYPIYLYFKNKRVARTYSSVKNIGMDEVFLGQRGTDYAALRRKVDKVKEIKGCTILIIGIGTGRDLESWLNYKPKKIIAVDYFNYAKAWKMRINQYKNLYDTKIEFLQADITDLNSLKENSIDIIGSDAVFEHINQFAKAITELKRVMSNNGVLYANFGPLWYSWGGDHISGTDHPKNAYNHIRLDEDKYHQYLDSFGEFSHSEHDGRTWIKNNLFSYLKPKEYLGTLKNKGLVSLYSSCTIDEKTVAYQKTYPEKYQELSQKFDEENLLVSGMTIIYAKK